MPKTKTRKRKATRKVGYRQREERYEERLASMPAGKFAEEMRRGADLLKRVLTGS